MAWNISEIMENENVPGCNLNIEQLETAFLGETKTNIVSPEIFKPPDSFKLWFFNFELWKEHFTFY